MFLATSPASLSTLTVGCAGLRHAVIAPIRFSTPFANAYSTSPAPKASQPQLLLAGVRTKPRFFKTAAAADAAGSSDPNSSPTGSQDGESKPLDYTKLGALGFMFFISCFNYTILQSLKDALVVTQIGAEALPFLGAYGVFPGSIIFFMYYGWVTKALPERVHYYAALTPFLIFYGVFAFLLFPMAPQLHPTHLLAGLKAFLPDGLVGLSGVLINWLYSLFFIVGELWGGVAISMLFWGLADEVCSLQEAKEVYPALGMVANIGLIGAGAWIKFVNGSFTDGSSWASMRWLVGSILVTSGAMFIIKNFVDVHYLADAHAASEAELERKKKRSKGKKKEKDPGAMTRAIDVLKQSPKVGNLAILVIAYFVVAKLFDFAWKAQLRVFYPSNNDFQSALAGVSQWTGIVTIAMMATSRFLFQYLGWGGAAIIPPIAILLSGSVFFASALIANNPDLVPIDMAVWIIPIGAAAGVVGRVLMKASKYSIFDPAKEMVFITMNKEEKLEGKAAVDLLGSYFGKSGASIMMQVMILVFGSLNSSMPLILVVHVAVCLAWTKSTASLASLMKKEEDVAAAAPPAADSVDIAAPETTTEDATDRASPSIKVLSMRSNSSVPPPSVVFYGRAGAFSIKGGVLNKDELETLITTKTKTGTTRGEVVTEKGALESTFSDDEA